MRAMLTAACLLFTALTLLNVYSKAYPSFENCLNHEGIVKDCYNIYGDLK